MNRPTLLKHHSHQQLPQFNSANCPTLLNLNSSSDTDPVTKKPKSTLCTAKEQPLDANVPENDQSMDTTAPLPEDEDEALSQEVYEILKRRHSSSSENEELNAPL